MRNTGTPWPRVAAGLVVCLTISAPAFASTAAASPESVCRQSIATGLDSWMNRTLRARLRCEYDKTIGVVDAATNCLTGAGSPELQSRLAKADAQLKDRLDSACADANWGLLSYPGPCSGVAEGTFGSDTLTACIDSVGAQITADLFDLWYPASTGIARGVAADCLKKVPKRAAAMVLGEARLRLACLLAQDGAAATSGDCRRQLSPYGVGTGDSVLDGKISRAQRVWASGLPHACARADFAALGFGAKCTPPPSSGSGILEFHSCVFEANRLKVPLLLDLAFPSAPVCGNGLHQEGEACDNGAANSDTKPDACRSDCTLPVCGDGVTDPGNSETCDDGNTASLDGCDAACHREVCGDGIVNDLPHEVCDDHNTNDHDMCTAVCSVATCGDGVVCSDPGCTTGPGGGPEQCDHGAGNAADGICKPDCSGFSRVCTLTVAVTNTVKLGALTWEFDYSGASGDMIGTGTKVQCTSTATGGFQSFFDNDGALFVKGSLIVDAGIQAPTPIAKCKFATNNAALGAGAFLFTIDAASNPAFNPVDAFLSVTNVDCQ